MRRILAELQRIANTRGRNNQSQFIVEGEHINLRAVRAGTLPDKLVISEARLATPSAETSELLTLVGSNCELFAVPDAELIEFAQGRNSGLVVGVFSRRDNASLAQLAIPKPEDFLALVLVDVQEPGNVGALVRTGLAGFVNVIVCVGVSDPYHPKAVRTSMGSLFRVPVLRVPTVEPVIEVTTGYRRLAAVAEGGRPPWDIQLTGATALFVGNEARGLPASVTATVEHGVTVPMQDGVDSYSVNAATAILLYEFGARRRH